MLNFSTFFCHWWLRPANVTFSENWSMKLKCPNLQKPLGTFYPPEPFNLCRKFSLKSPFQNHKRVKCVPLSCKINKIKPAFTWSIFVRAVIDHMIFSNLNWPKIKL